MEKTNQLLETHATIEASLKELTDTQKTVYKRNELTYISGMVQKLSKKFTSLESKETKLEEAIIDELGLQGSDAENAEEKQDMKKDAIANSGMNEELYNDINWGKTVEELNQVKTEKILVAKQVEMLNEKKNLLIKEMVE